MTNLCAAFGPRQPITFARLSAKKELLYLAAFTRAGRHFLVLPCADRHKDEATIFYRPLSARLDLSAWRDQLHERRKAEIDALKAAISENCTEIESARRLPLDRTSSLLVTRG